MSRDKCYILVSPDVPLALCQTPSLKAATVEVDRYREYGHSLDHILPSSHLLALAYNDGATLYLNDGISTSNIVLDSCQYWNLFHGSTVCVKLKPYPIPKPVYATTVSVALVRSGNFQVCDFTEHLRIYFSSPKILIPGQVIAVNIPRNIPKSISLEEFLRFASRNARFLMDTCTVHFKINSAQDHDGKDLSGFFMISSAKTTLYQVSMPYNIFLIALWL